MTDARPLPPFDESELRAVVAAAGAGARLGRWKAESIAAPWWARTTAFLLEMADRAAAIR